MNTQTTKFAAALTACFTFVFLLSAAQAVTITEDFEGVVVPGLPLGWSTVGTATTAVDGSTNGTNVLTVPKDGSRNYLANDTMFDTTQDISGSFDFYVVDAGFYTNAAFLFGDVDTSPTDSAGEYIRVHLDKKTFGSRADILDGDGSTLFDGSGNNNYEISTNTWYSSTFSWTAATGDFSFSWGGTEGPMTVSGYSFNDLGVFFGFGTFDDAARFDNISITGTEYSEYLWDGGAGNWSTGTDMWDSGVWVNGENAHFGSGGAGTATITDSNVTTGVLILDDTYLIQDNGGGETLTANGPIMVSSNSEISAAIVGTGGLTKAGSATLELSGTNTYTGGTTVSAGALLVTGTLASQGGAGTTIASGATLQVGDGTTAGTIGTEAISNSGTLAFDLPGSASFSNTISGGGVLTAATGGNTLTLSGSNTLGAVTVSDGVLELTGATNTIASLNASSGAATFNGSGAQAVSGAISGSITQSGSGALSLTGDNSGSTATVTVDNGSTLNVGGDLGSSVGVVNNGAVSFNTASTVAVGGVISGSGDLNQSGAGTTTLSGNNSYGGATNVTGGELVVTGAVNSSSGIAVSNGGKLTVNSGTALTAPVTVTGATSVVEVAASRTVGTVGVSGNSTLLLGLNATTGAVSVNGGTLSVDGSATVGGTGVTVGAGGATLNWDFTSTSDYDQILGALANNGGTLTINVNALGTVQNGDAFTLFTGAVDNLANISVTGDLSGYWEVSSGSLILTSTIPEPSTIILAGLGLVGVTFRRRRK